MIISHNPKFLCLNPPKTGTGYIEFVFEYSGIFTNDLINKVAEKEKDVIKLKGYECPEEFIAS